MSWTQTIDLATRIKPEIIVQELSNIETVKSGMKMKEVFKKETNVMDSFVDRQTTAADIMSIPFVGDGESGSAKSSPTYTDLKLSVPAMKAHVRIKAKDLKAAARYKNTDFMTWLRENYLVALKNDIAFSLEYLKRHMLADGNMAYPYHLKSGWTTANLTLGTLVAGGTASNLWDTAATTGEDIHSFLKTVIKTAKATDGSYQYFQSAKDIKIFCPDTVWDYAFGKLATRQTIDVVNSQLLNEEEMKIGNYTLTAFGAQWKNPQTGALADAVTAKTIRIVDVGAMARHTLAFLELDNVLASGSNKHVLVHMVPDPYGEYIDIVVQFRPVPLFNPAACITATVLS